MPRGGVLPPTPVLAPGSALGSRPRVALSSAQVASVYRTSLRPSKGSLLGLGPPPRADRHPFGLPCRPGSHLDRPSSAPAWCRRTRGRGRNGRPGRCSGG